MAWQRSDIARQSRLTPDWVCDQIAAHVRASSDPFQTEYPQ